VSDRGDVAVHRIDRLEGHDLGRLGIGRGQELLEMGGVVVAEDLADRARVPDARDHRGVVEGVRIELAARHHRAQRLQGGLVGDIARGEDERRFLLMQPRQLMLQRHVQRVGAGDVARAAGARTLRADRGLHCLHHGGMLAHAEIVVAAPHGNFARSLSRAVKPGARKGADDALELGEDPVSPLVAQAIEVAGEKRFVVHCAFCLPRPDFSPVRGGLQTHFGRNYA
jgi:hypothetical protein